MSVLDRLLHGDVGRRLRVTKLDRTDEALDALDVDVAVSVWALLVKERVLKQMVDVRSE